MKKLIDIVLLTSALLVLILSYQEPCNDNNNINCKLASANISSNQNVTEENLNNPKTNNSLLIISFFITFLCLLIILFMLIFRYITIGKTAALVPEEWGKILNQNSNNITNSLNSLVVNSKQNNLNFDNTSKNVSKILEVLLSYQKALDEKDLLLKRYQEGYDTKLVKDFISKFLYRYKKLEKIIEQEEFNRKTIENYSNYLFSAIEECGVEVINIEVGADYRNLGNRVSDAPRIYYSSAKEKDFKIKEIIENGYCIVTDEEPIILIPSKVAIYKFNDKGEN